MGVPLALRSGQAVQGFAALRAALHSAPLLRRALAILHALNANAVLISVCKEFKQVVMYIANAPIVVRDCKSRTAGKPKHISIFANQHIGTLSHITQ